MSSPYFPSFYAVQNANDAAREVFAFESIPGIPQYPVENVFQGTGPSFRLRPHFGTPPIGWPLHQGRSLRREFHPMLCAVRAGGKKRRAVEPAQIDGLLHGFRLPVRNPRDSAQGRPNHRILQRSPAVPHQCKIAPISAIQIFRCFFDVKEGALSPEAISSLFSPLPNSEPLWEHLQTPRYPLFSPLPASSLA